MEIIAVLADIATIATGAVAVWFWFRLRGDVEKRTLRLEQYLLGERKSGDAGQRSALHLMANLGMTEPQLFEAALRSRHIRLVPGQDQHGQANRIYFQHTNAAAN